MVEDHTTMEMQLQAVEQVIIEDLEAVEAILRLQKARINVYMSPAGLQFSGQVEPLGWEGHGWVHRDIIESRDRIEVHFARLLDVIGVELTKDHGYIYPALTDAD